jgi:hypothetical protein
LVKTLLASSRWWSKVTFLKWQVRQLCSERKIRFTDTNTEEPLPWNESAETAKPMDMRSHRYLFQLAPLGLPTDETECSSSDTDFKLLNTPTSVQTSESPESLRARMDAHGWKNGTKYGSLQSQILHDPKAQKMLGLLPTPTAIEGVKWTNTWNPNSQMGQSLSAMAGSGMLPTPTARDWKGETNPGVRKEGSGCIYGDTLPDTVMREAKKQDVVGGRSSRLSPLFTEEMMGFPFLWTTLPFLSQNGETNPSKPTETQ